MMAGEFYPESVNEYFSFESSTFEKDKSRRSHNRYAVKKTIFEGTMELQLDYLFFQAKRKRKEMLVVLIPTISGVSALERSVARYFSNRGMDVIVPVAFETEIIFDENTVKYMDRGFLRPVAQTKLMVEELRAKTNYKKTFVLGASQGGIRTSMLLGYDLGFDKAYTFVAGGDFPKLYAETTVKSLIEFRKNHMSALGLTDVADYEKYLRDNLSFDPKVSCSNRKAKMRMLVATKDTSVPTSTQYSLWKACGEPDLIEVKGGHVKGVLKMYSKRKEVLKYFLEE